MRQPDRIQITPSAPCDWYGGWDADQRMTWQQRATLGRLGFDPEKVEWITVRRRAVMAEMWWPEGQAAPVFEMPCPIIQRRADGCIKIISPAGVNRVVQPDGWITKRQSWVNSQQNRRGS
jgi:hypothetical protein